MTTQTSQDPILELESSVSPALVLALEHLVGWRLLWDTAEASGVKSNCHSNSTPIKTPPSVGGSFPKLLFSSCKRRTGQKATSLGHLWGSTSFVSFQVIVGGGVVFPVGHSWSVAWTAFNTLSLTPGCTTGPMTTSNVSRTFETPFLEFCTYLSKDQTLTVHKLAPGQEARPTKHRAIL